MTLRYSSFFPILTYKYFEPPLDPSVSVLFVSVVSSLAHQLDIGLLVFCLLLALCLYPLLAFLPSFLPSFRPSVLSSCDVVLMLHHIIGHIVPANSTLCSGLGLRHARMFASFFFVFLFFLFFFPFMFILFLLSSPSFFRFFFSSVHIMSWISSWCYLVASDAGWYNHSSLVPFPSRTGMVLPCALFRTGLFSPIEMHSCYSLFCNHSQHFRELS